jgi:hypothetical protein
MHLKNKTRCREFLQKGCLPFRTAASGGITVVGTFIVLHLIVGQPDLSCKHHHFSKESPGAGHAGIFFAAYHENAAPVDDYSCSENFFKQFF